MLVPARAFIVDGGQGPGRPLGELVLANGKIVRAYAKALSDAL